MKYEYIFFIVTINEGGANIIFNTEEYKKTQILVSENDPFGMVKECAKYNIYPETPHYLPKGFELDYINHKENSKWSNIVTFVYKNGNQRISFDFQIYWKETETTEFPSDNTSQITLNGHNAIVSKNDNQYKILYCSDKMVFKMFAVNVSYDECDKIVESIK